MRRHWLAWVACSLLLSGPCAAQGPKVMPAASAPAAKPLVFIIPTNHAPPMVVLEGKRLAPSILRDLGEALAAELQRPAQFVMLPARRAQTALVDGSADLMCYVLPAWIQVPVQWSVPVLPNASVLASRADAPPVQGFQDLATEPMGTVLGYTYAPADKVLGSNWTRDDAPDMTSNLRKLAAGRLRYAITEQIALDAFLKVQPQPGMKVQFVFDKFSAPCALSRSSHLPLKDLNTGLLALQRDGRLDRILAAYR